MNEIQNDFLEHHGVLGMRWGVRHDYQPIGRHRGNSKNVGSSSKGKKRNNLRKLRIARNIAIGAAVVAGVALGATAYSKWARYNKDVIIKGGEALQRIARQGSTGLHDDFYAAIGKHDMERYKNTLPWHFDQFEEGSHVLKMLEANKNLKIASPNNGKKIFDDLVARDQVFADLYGTSYEAFNRNYTVNRQYASAFGNEPQFNKFKDAVKAAGYDGVVDINDLKYSGYNAHKPVIVFDHNAAKVKHITEIGGSRQYNEVKAQAEFGKAALEAVKEEEAWDPNHLKLLGKYTAAGAGSAGAAQAKIEYEERHKQRK